MFTPENRTQYPHGLFDNPMIMSARQSLRRDAMESRKTQQIIDWVQRSGATMVVDSEVAHDDMDNTLERVRIATRSGMRVIEIGGSTNENNAAAEVIPEIRRVVDEEGGHTLLASFAGGSDQVQKGVDVTYSLFLPQLDRVFKQQPHIADLFNKEYMEIIDRSKSLDIPVISMTYILFDTGKITTVQRVTGIDGVNVQDGVDTQVVMEEINPWLDDGDVVKAEAGSAPKRFTNLGPVAVEIYKKTGVRPIVTGGISTPEHMRQVTQYIDTPVVFGTRAENTPPEQFEQLCKNFMAAHPSNQQSSIS